MQLKRRTGPRLLQDRLAPRHEAAPRHGRRRAVPCWPVSWRSTRRRSLCCARRIRRNRPVSSPPTSHRRTSPPPAKIDWSAAGVARRDHRTRRTEADVVSSTRSTDCFGLKSLHAYPSEHQLLRSLPAPIAPGPTRCVRLLSSVTLKPITYKMLNVTGINGMSLAHYRMRRHQQLVSSAGFTVMLITLRH